MMIGVHQSPIRSVVRAIGQATSSKRVRLIGAPSPQRDADSIERTVPQ
jgi:hypothetical protein